MKKEINLRGSLIKQAQVVAGAIKNGKDKNKQGG